MRYVETFTQVAKYSDRKLNDAVQKSAAFVNKK